MPATTVTVARPKTKLICARDAPRSASTGVRKTLKAYSVPNGRLTAVAARSAATLRCPGLKDSLLEIHLDLCLAHGLSPARRRGRNEARELCRRGDRRNDFQSGLGKRRSHRRIVHQRLELAIEVRDDAGIGLCRRENTYPDAEVG